MSEIGKLGARQTNARWEGSPFDPDELGELKDLEDAKLALDTIRRAVLSRQITPNEGNSATKAVSEWCKAETASITKQLVNELHRELEAKEKQIQELRQQLSGRGMRAVK